MYSVRPGAQDNNLSTAVCKHGSLQFKPDGGGVGRSASHIYLIFIFASAHPLLCLRADGATFNHQRKVVSDSEAKPRHRASGLSLTHEAACLTGLLKSNTLYGVCYENPPNGWAPRSPEVYQSPHTHTVLDSTPKLRHHHLSHRPPRQKGFITRVPDRPARCSIHLTNSTNHLSTFKRCSC